VTYLVAYDGGNDSETVLRRATAFADRTDEDLMVVSVLPTDDDLAETYGFAGADGYDPEATADRLETAVLDAAPDATFRAERVDDYGGKGRVARRIAAVAGEVGADVVFVGADDVGRVVRRLAGDGATAGDHDFDVFLVRTD
jgi:nucleotide-binding universal stress UspA family protein